MGMALTVPRYTVEELRHFPDDGNRYEILDGTLLVTPAPSLLHQRIVTALMGPLIAAMDQPLHAHVVAPGAVVLRPRTQLEPDILVIPARFSRDATWDDVTEHWLAVEVLSPSSRVYDRDFKRDAYLALGVQEVWLVDPTLEEIEVSRPRGQRENVRDLIRWRAPTLDVVVTINLRDVFPRH